MPETTLNIRGIEAKAAARIKRAAAARAQTIGEYLERLVDLHDAMRAIADLGGAGSTRVEAELVALGLTTVHT